MSYFLSISIFLNAMLATTIISAQTSCQSKHIKFSDENMNMELSENFLDFKNMFFVNNKAYDIRTLKEVATETMPGYTVQFTESKVLGLYSNNRIMFFTEKGKKIGNIWLGNSKKPSPNLKYVLFIEEGDYWKQDVIDFTRLGDKKRLTNLGAFRNVVFDHWYGDIIYPNTGWGGKTYSLNVKTGELGEYTGGYLGKKGSYIDPYEDITLDGRYLLYSEDKDLYAFDFENGTKKHIRKQPDDFLLSHGYVWLSKDTFFSFVYNPNSHDPVLAGSRFSYSPDQGIELINNYPWIFSGLDGTYFNANQYRELSFVEKFNGRSRCVAPKGRYFIYPTTGVISSNSEIALVDLEDATVEIIIKDDEQNPIGNNSIVHSFFVGSTQASFRWTSPTKFIYTTVGDLLTQGTWIMDVESKEIKKVSSFVSQEFWVFDNTRLVLFRANNKLYRVNSDGTDLQEMTNINYVNKNTPIEKLIK